MLSINRVNSVLSKEINMRLYERFIGFDAIDSLVGKTITVSVEDLNLLLLKFSDDTWTGVQGEWLGDENSITHPRTLTLEQLSDAGLITSDEFTEAKRAAAQAKLTSLMLQKEELDKQIKLTRLLS